MPHLTVEYTSNLPTFDANDVLLALNKVLASCGHFEDMDIKSRALRLDTHLVGLGQPCHGFVHAKLAILSGRSEDTKRALSDALLRALQAVGRWPADTDVQLCVEVQEIERASYAKVTVGA